uniref:Reverse transcriptase domain-containing protein n=1 Tax=Amphimedon queenslandica TaxID=400682 RepID=A0A1X7UX59_AMPQE
MKLPITNSIGLPCVGSYVYVEWNEPDSLEPSGWYHCQVIEYESDGKALLSYRDGATEVLDLRKARWEHTRKNGKAFLPFDVSPPTYQLKRVRQDSKLPKFTPSTPQRVKAYADDLTLISKSKVDHQSALKEVDNACRELGLEFRPDKCVSYCFDGEKPLPHTVFNLNDGKTRNISSGPTKFLGETIGLTPTLSKRAATKKITKKLYDALCAIDSRPIRGEYKAWIYKSYLAPAIQFHLSVDKISAGVTKKIQRRATSLLKKWLKIPRCATLAVLFHPEILNIPYLPHLLEKSKLRFLSLPSLSHDHNIKSLSTLISDPKFLESENVPPKVAEIISTSNPPNKLSELRLLLKQLRTSHIFEWNSSLESLTVQNKLLDIIPLESDSKVWSRVITALPAGQLSFIIRAGIDCLPTPMTLCRWKYRTDSSCGLCNAPQCTVNHILSCCPTSLLQGRYTWRHDTVLKRLYNLLRDNLDESVTIFADLNNLRASDTPPATIPLNIIVTTARPDIVIIDGRYICLLELTIP